MAHGSGGLLMHRLLEQGVWPLLDNPLLARRHDGAVFDLKGTLAMSTDTYVVSPIFFPGGNIGELAVNGTVNDLAMCGAQARYLSLGLVLEEGLPLEQLRLVLESVASACRQAGVQIVTGDTKVVERGKGDGVFINTTGIGVVHPKARIDSRRIEVGDRLLLSGPLAAHGMAVMSCRQGLAFETSLQSDTRPLNGIVAELLDTFGAHIHLLRDPTRGGIGTTLNELAKDSALGMEIQEAALPLEPEVMGACEMLGLDPLYVANEGIFLAVVAAEVADACLQQLRRWEHGYKAACIGQVVAAHPGQVLLQSRIGGRRVVHMPAGEQLPRIC